jgi:AcrR family transcriptional regulator
LAKEGPTRFTIEAVAKLAGCGKPTIYRWWPFRHALLLEVYQQAYQQELVEPEGKDLAKDLATMLRRVWRFWREDYSGSLFRLILSEMMLEDEGTRYLREVFIPRRQAFTATAFQAAKDRGEIPPETDIKSLIDLFYGYSMLRLLTGQLDDEEIPDRIRPSLPNSRGAVFRAPLVRRNGRLVASAPRDLPNVRDSDRMRPVGPLVIWRLERRYPGLFSFGLIAWNRVFFSRRGGLVIFR